MSFSLGHLIALTALFVIIGYALTFSNESLIGHFRVTFADALFESFEGMLDDMDYSPVDEIDELLEILLSF